MNRYKEEIMLITRRSDYAFRICRVLQDGKVHNVREICDKEEIPRAFAYKILRELEMADLVKSERGNQGGYFLNKPLDELTIYDVASITEGDLAILHCMKEDCSRNPEELPCKVHMEMERIQEILVAEMKKKTIADIING
jgi:Rrf2 family protein